VTGRGWLAKAEPQDHGTVWFELDFRSEFINLYALSPQK